MPSSAGIQGQMKPSKTYTQVKMHSFHCIANVTYNEALVGWSLWWQHQFWRVQQVRVTDPLFTSRASKFPFLQMKESKVRFGRGLLFYFALTLSLLHCLVWYLTKLYECPTVFQGQLFSFINLPLLSDMPLKLLFFIFKIDFYLSLPTIFYHFHPLSILYFRSSCKHVGSNSFKRVFWLEKLLLFGPSLCYCLIPGIILRSHICINILLLNFPTSFWISTCFLSFLTPSF